MVPLWLSHHNQNNPPSHSKRPARIIAENDTGQIEIIYFRPNVDYLKSLLIGEKRLLSGRVELFQGRPQMAHPDYVLAMDKAAICQRFRRYIH